MSSANGQDAISEEPEDDVKTEPETETPEEEAPPQSPTKKNVCFEGLADVSEEEEDEEAGGRRPSRKGSMLDEDEPLLPRRQSVLNKAYRRTSGVPDIGPRRMSINTRRRGSWGQGVLTHKTPEPRRQSIIVGIAPPAPEDIKKRRYSAPRVTFLEEPKDEEVGEAKEAKEEGESIVVAGEAEEERATWGGQIEFLLTCVGYAVGLGNVWRFPYLCYKNGGGAFLLPYILMLALVGLPLFFMELAFGQFASLGPITIWKINPLFKGVGYGMVIVSWLIALYYNVVIAHTIFYLFASMTSVLPWTTCDNPWNTDACLLPPSDHTPTNSSLLNGTLVNATASLLNTTATVRNTTGTKTPSEEYYTNYVLEQSSGIDEFGLPSWKLTLCLLLAWIIVLAVLLKGIQSLGKVVYFTAIFPYIMLTVLLIRGVTLPGAGKGILYYLEPDFSRLADSRVWSDATTQIFYSLSAGSGGLIAMASYNKFDNNCHRDSIIVALINCGTSIFAGFVIFAVLGFMAYEKNVDVGDVAAGGPGLAFVVYPEAISRMPIAPLWSILFFIMMATLGFGSQFSIMECVLSAFTDEFKRFIRGQKESIIFRCCAIGLSFILGIPMVCKGGIYLLNLVDYSVSGFPLLFISFLELVALNWIYGFSRLAEDFKMMLGHKPNIYWKACWVVVSPVIIVVTVVFNVILYVPPELDGYFYPEWAQALGWLIALWPILVIPGWFMYQYCRDGGWALLREAVKPEIEWGPALRINRTDAYGDSWGEDNDAYISSKSTIISTRENLSNIVVCNNRRNVRNGSTKRSSSPQPKTDGSSSPKKEMIDTTPTSEEPPPAACIIKSETCV